MKKKLYDNYDYEEAYQKQIANLEEWELEKLMKDGKVECLYRTTTTKSENIKSGTVLLEAQVYPSFKDKKDVPVTAKKRETRPSQKNLTTPGVTSYAWQISILGKGIFGPRLGGMMIVCRIAKREPGKTYRISLSG